MDEWPPASITLRDDSEITLRVCSDDDLESLYELDLAVVRDGRGVVRTDEDLADREAFRARHGKSARTLRGGADGLFLVAVDGDGAVVGEGKMWRAGVSLCRHTTFVALSVHPRAQGQGLGRALMDALMAWARTVTPPVERIGLFTLADNERALQLYASLGFEREGLRRRYVRRPDGTYVDDVIMGLVF